MGSIREVIKADGTSSFHAEVRLRGHPAQRASFRTKSLAKKWIQDTESAIRDGRHFKTAAAKKYTVAELIDRFIAQWLPKFPKRQIKQTALLNWWKHHLGHLVLADLTPAIIAEARDILLTGTTIRKALRSPSTVNRYLASFSKVLTVAVQEWGWLDDSPMRKVSKPSEAKGRHRFLSIEEKDRFLAACKTSKNPYLYPVVSIALLTGMRFGEIIRLKWEDIDVGSGLIVLQETKNGDRRYIPLFPALQIVFEAIQPKNQQGKIFASQRLNNQSGVLGIRGAFAKALKEANIENFRFHDLRHTAASYLAMQGATQGELMAILGHKTPAMTRRYAHYSQDHIREILKKASI